MTLVGEKFVTITRCSELAGVSEATIQQYIAVGIINSNEEGLIELKEASRVLLFDHGETAQPQGNAEVQSLLLTQLVELKEERDWLKDRIEKLETNLERTQVLALTSRPARKSFWKTLLTRRTELSPTERITETNQS